MTQWLFAEIHPQSPVFWLLISVVVTATLAVVHWRTRSPWVTWIWIGQWILIPYAGLLLGGLSPRLMGLAYLDWPATFGLGSGLLFVTLALLAAVRITLSLSESATDNTSRTANPSVQATAPRWKAIAPAILLSGAEEFHWVFLRGAVWEVLLTAPLALELPAYWAIWIAAALAVAEAALRRPTFEQWLVQIVALVTTSILFLYTRNFWLCWILHSATVLILTAGRTQPFLPTAPASSRRPDAPAPPVAK